MSNRRTAGTVKIEAVIETCRSEGKWQRVIELAEELKIGSPNNGESYISWDGQISAYHYLLLDCLASFLVGEGKLESYLEENPPIESNFTKAKVGLQDSRHYLNLVVGENGRQAGIALDAHLLLAKLLYACGEYEESLENFVKAELNSLSEKELTLRSLKILAESYAIKGLCLENQELSGSSKFKKASLESELVSQVCVFGCMLIVIIIIIIQRFSASNEPPIWVCSICKSRMSWKSQPTSEVWVQSWRPPCNEPQLSSLSPGICSEPSTDIVQC